MIFSIFSIILSVVMIWVSLMAYKEEVDEGDRYTKMLSLFIVGCMLVWLITAMYLLLVIGGGHT